MPRWRGGSTHKPSIPAIGAVRGSSLFRRSKRLSDIIEAAIVEHIAWYNGARLHKPSD